MKARFAFIFFMLMTLLPVVSFPQAKDTIVDSRHTWPELQKKFIAFYTDSSANGLNEFQKKNAMQWISSQLSLVNVVYISYDGRIHAGQIICNKYVAKEVQDIFNELLHIKFPVNQCKPVSEFGFTDTRSMQANNTSGFDYRLKTGSRTMSKHAYGLAIDINPVENPYKKGKEILPSNNNENTATGRIRITEEQGKKVIAIFRKYGWTWGGNWRSLKDYMHFEKQQ